MHIRSVSDITAYIKALLDGDELLADCGSLARSRIAVVRPPVTCTLRLKDGSAEMRCVMWRNQAARLGLCASPR